MDDLECPYCGEWCNVDDNEGPYFEQDIIHEMECHNCQKVFIFYTSISFSYSAQKADCLNDGNHDDKYTHTHPKECTRMMCKICGRKREMTEDERLHFFDNIKK